MRIIVLLTCHNRRETTLRALRAFFTQVHIDSEISAVVVDDGSTDGTANAVTNEFSAVRILQGDGALYWSGGMRLAMNSVRHEKYDFVCWLNDDTIVYPDALSRLLATYGDLKEKYGISPIITGSIVDSDSKNTTYGGLIHSNRVHKLRLRRIPVVSKPTLCDAWNGNLVLIPRDAVERNGNIHEVFIHGTGDYEYALRARRNGIQSWIAPGVFGECNRNSVRGTWVEPSISLFERYKRILSVKGIPPKQRLVYYYLHDGIFWFVFYPLVYFRPIGMWIRDFFHRSQNRKTT